MKILLDTNAYSDWRRSGDWNEAISTADEVLLPVIVLGELLFGFIGSSRKQENEDRLWRFLKEPTVKVPVVDETASRQYSLLKEQLRRQGTPIPENDLWISAILIGQGAILATSDAHFDHLPQLPRVSK